MKKRCLGKIWLVLCFLYFCSISCYAAPPKRRASYSSKPTGTLLTFSEEHIQQNSTEETDNAKFESILKEGAEHMRRTFPDAKPNKFTPMQEGACWCWAACLEGLAKFHGFNCPQESIVTGFNRGKIPSSNKFLRTEGLALSGIAGISDTGEISVPRAAIFDVTIWRDPEFIKNCILDYYTKISKNPFAICDSLSQSIHVAPGHLFAHMVNVVEISDENKMTIEDPATGLSRIESLGVFCQRFTELNAYPLIELISVIPQKGIPPMIRYFPDHPDNSVTLIPIKHGA